MTPTEALDQLREAFAALGFEVDSTIEHRLSLVLDDGGELAFGLYWGGKETPRCMVRMSGPAKSVTLTASAVALEPDP